jgi:hypothetical protein
MRDGIDVRRVARIGALAVAALVLVVTAAVLLTSRWDRGRPVQGQPATWISGAVLETEPQTDMRQYLQGKQHLIDTYAWVDRQAGIARIPLDQAMRALAEPHAEHAP